MEVTLGVLTLYGAWRILQGRDEALLRIANSASLGYSLIGFWAAWSNADPSHLQMGVVRNILDAVPMSEWRNLVVVDTLHGLASNALMLVWSSVSLRSTVFSWHLPALFPKLKHQDWTSVLASIVLSVICRLFVYSIDAQAGFYSTR